MTYILLLIGFALLIKGADIFVDGASKIATLLRVSPLIIGLTIVAIGTSAPEVTVSLIAAVKGNAEVALGNVIGSNILNITLVVGIAAFLYPMTVESSTIKKEIPFTLLGSIALLVLISDTYLQGVNENTLSRADGIMFLLLLSIFIYYVFEVAMKSRKAGTQTEVPSDVKWGKSILFVVIGIVGVVFGGQLVVDNGTEIALSLGMSETLVGLTIIAIGTSLPELMTSIVAALKKQSEIALGNIVGSNIYNILLVLGASSLITPLPVNDKVFIDIIIMIVITTVLLIFSRTRYRIGKMEGLSLVLIYVLYLVFIIWRN